jgi:hypothetical protein
MTRVIRGEASERVALPGLLVGFVAVVFLEEGRVLLTQGKAGAHLAGTWSCGVSERPGCCEVRPVIY